MFCPKCKAEYKSGITICADCDVQLVESLPEEQALPPKLPYKAYEGLFGSAEIAIIRSVLADAGIDYYFKGERFQTIHIPLVDPATLMIREDQYEDAIELLKELLSGPDQGNT